jgi:hypothetical protein
MRLNPLPGWYRDDGIYYARFLEPLSDAIKESLTSRERQPEFECLVALGISRRFADNAVPRVAAILSYLANTQLDGPQEAARRSLTPLLLDLLANWFDQGLGTPLSQPKWCGALAHLRPVDLRNLKSFVAIDALIQFYLDQGGELSALGLAYDEEAEAYLWVAIRQLYNHNKRTADRAPAPPKDAIYPVEFKNLCTAASANPTFWSLLFSKFAHAQQQKLEPAETQSQDQREALSEGIEQAIKVCVSLRGQRSAFDRVRGGLFKFSKYADDNPGSLGGASRRGDNKYWQWGKETYEALRNIEPECAQWLLKRRSDAEGSRGMDFRKFQAEFLATLDFAAHDTTDDTDIGPSIWYDGWLSEPDRRLTAVFSASGVAD